jgi:ubiquinone/menaquinone biosynthesis C-methylase UbiE
VTSVDFFKTFFREASLEIEDLFLLESFQLEYLPGWVSEAELAGVLKAHPAIMRFMLKKCPTICGFIERVTSQYGEAGNPEVLAQFEDNLVWTIADLLVYNKCPQVYDSLGFHGWDFNEITRITSLEGKIVVEGGAGTGRVTLRLAQHAKQVYAVEPVTRLRQFIRRKVQDSELKNIYVLDGTLHSIPLPDNFADILVTSHALGWYLEDELPEFERVVKSGGTIIHCPGTAVTAGGNETHTTLISPAWNYRVAEYQEPDGAKRKYWKQVT